MAFILGLIVGLVVGGCIVVLFYRRNKEHMLALESILRKNYANLETKAQDEITKLLDKNK